MVGLVAVSEVLAQESASAALCFGMHCVGTAVIAAKATETQRERYLVPIARGEHLTTLALSEPGTRYASATLNLIGSLPDWSAYTEEFSGGIVAIAPGVGTIAVWAPELDAKGDGVAIQTIKLEHEGWERDYDVTEPSEPSFLEPAV